MIAWKETYDGDQKARELADRHYSRKTVGARLFCGPGEKLILITADKKAVFVWRKCRYRMDGQTGVECTMFRNEGGKLSSSLIIEACKWAWMRWPGERLFTYVRDAAVKSSNPGFCFLSAGWSKCGRNKFGKLTILENLNYSEELPVFIQPRQQLLFG